jgi:hypothetical protein
MQQMMDFQFAKQRHEELLREAEMNRQVNRAGSIEVATKLIEGAARSMGIRVSNLWAGVASKRPRKGFRRWLGT